MVTSVSKVSLCSPIKTNFKPKFDWMLPNTPTKVLGFGAGLIGIGTTAWNFLKQGDFSSNSFLDNAKKWFLPVVSFFVSIISYVLSNKQESKLEVISDKTPDLTLQKPILKKLFSNILGKVPNMADLFEQGIEVADLFAYFNVSGTSREMVLELVEKFGVELKRAPNQGLYIQTVHENLDGTQNELYSYKNEDGRHKVYGFRLLITNDMLTKWVNFNTPIQFEILTKDFDANNESFVRVYPSVKMSINDFLNEGGWVDEQCIGYIKLSGQNISMVDIQDTPHQRDGTTSLGLTF